MEADNKEGGEERQPGQPLTSAPQHSRCACMQNHITHPTGTQLKHREKPMASVRTVCYRVTGCEGGLVLQRRLSRSGRAGEWESGRAGERESGLGTQEHLTLFRMARALFSSPILDSSKPPITPLLRDPTPSSSLCEHQSNTHTEKHLRYFSERWHTAKRFTFCTHTVQTQHYQQKM